MKLLIKRIKEKKSLMNLDDEFIKEYIKEYLKKNKNLEQTLKTRPRPERSKEFKKAAKEIRNELNRIYGQFQLNNKLDLESHKSTRERIKIYPYIYKKIFQITGKPKRILDISCGLNPLSYKYLGCKPYYVATELTEKDTQTLNNYFRKNKINGKAIQVNLFKKPKFPESDITFLFKVVDTLNNKKLAEEIINNLNTRYIVASFSLITIKGKRMNYPLQGWFQRMLKRLNLRYDVIKEKNEIFYVIRIC